LKTDSDIFKGVVERLALTRFHLSNPFSDGSVIILPSHGFHRLLMRHPSPKMQVRLSRGFTTSNGSLSLEATAIESSSLSL